MIKSLPIVSIYTDGSSLGNPGAGGWAAILKTEKAEKEISGFQNEATNNQMEMKAALFGLRALKRPAIVKIYSDSQYLIKGMTIWMEGWKKKNWKNAQKKDVENQDLWKALDIEARKHSVEWFWIRGHNGHAENERADALARAEAERLIQN